MQVPGVYLFRFFAGFCLISNGVYIGGGSIQGSIGQGPVIVVETDRGSLTVRKDSGAPLAAHNEKSSEDHIRPEIEKH